MIFILHTLCYIDILWLLFQLPVHAYIVKIGYIGNFRSFRGFSGLLFSKLRLTEKKLKREKATSNTQR